MPATHYKEIRKLGELIHDIRICMLTTVGGDGHLHSRPMATQQIEFDGDLWFFTGKSTHMAQEVEREQRVNVSYANPEKQHYVSISGIAECVEDKVKAKQLWHDSYKVWFPDGLDDPNLTLMKVKVEKAEYWDSIHDTVNLLSYLAGRRPDPGEHEQIDLTEK